MKRIIVFCDGTWNKLSSQYATNVQLAAQATLPQDSSGVQQVTFYDEGVGTSYLISEWIETRLAGAFGWGLLEKIEAAYRFIALNYVPGDQIYIFGFSRGAYTARSLAGLIRKCGIVPRTAVKNIKSIFDFYKRSDVLADSDDAQRFRLQHSPGIVMKASDKAWRAQHGVAQADLDGIPVIDLRYVGVWDSVGALGIPRHLFISDLIGSAKKYEFHDMVLSSVVRAARHAVAVDEGRESFEPALWSNLDELNGDSGRNYQQLWFPGDHGSVGGGGDITGLSMSALLWVLEGAAEQGLAFDDAMLATFASAVDNNVPLRNMSAPPNLLDQIYRRKPRKGPQKRALLAPSTVDRLKAESKAAGWKAYRPQTLMAIHKNALHFE